MKKWLPVLAVVALLSACSTSNEDKQQAGDPFVKNKETPSFTPLAGGGVTLPAQDPRFNMPAKPTTAGGQNVDIRPPSKPLALINDSVAQFDGERASIVYPADKQGIYNIQQLSRLLTERGIKHSLQNNTIQTDWTASGRADDIGDLQLRYEFTQLGNREAGALTAAILQAKRNNVVFTPTTGEKQRYASDRLNELVGELKNAYSRQQQQLNISNNAQPQVAANKMESVIAQDRNGRDALVVKAPFGAVWQKLGAALPYLGFKIEEENPGRGFRKLEYKALDNEVWQRVNAAKPELKNDDYQMQLSLVGNNTAVVLTDEDGQPLKKDQAMTIYHALSNLLAY